MSAIPNFTRIAESASRIDATLAEQAAPQPLPAELLPVESFPLAALPDTLRPWVSDVSERMQCPPDYACADLSGAPAERRSINHGLKALGIGSSAWTAEALKLTMPAASFTNPVGAGTAGSPEGVVGCASEPPPLGMGSPPGVESAVAGSPAEVADRAGAAPAARTRGAHGITSSRARSASAPRSLMERVAGRWRSPGDPARPGTFDRSPRSRPRSNACRRAGPAVRQRWRGVRCGALRCGALR